MSNSLASVEAPAPTRVPPTGPPSSSTPTSPSLQLPFLYLENPIPLGPSILTCSSTPLMMSRGSSTFPRDLLIFRPCLSRTME